MDQTPSLSFSSGPFAARPCVTQLPLMSTSVALGARIRNTNAVVQQHFDRFQHVGPGVGAGGCAIATPIAQKPPYVRQHKLTCIPCTSLHRTWMEVTHEMARGSC